MTDIQGLRAQLRDSRPRSAPRVSGGGGVPFWAIAIGAAVVGFGIVLFAPRFFTTQRTAALPDFQEAVSRSADGGQVSAPERQAGAPPASVQLVPAQPAPAAAPQPVKAQPAPPAQPAPVQPSPAQPSPAQPSPAQPAAVHPAPAPVSRYAGKAPEDVVRLSDAVCEQRAQAVRSGVQPAPRNAQGRQEEGGNGHRITAADEKLHCFLTEAPARFCAPNQKRKVAADVINYFKGIEYTNAAVAVAAKVAAMKPSGEAPVVLNKAEVDPRVVEAIEGVIRAGYLTKANRDEIGANVPRELKDRFARIVGSTPPCPKPPWWASFL
jgi:hypothetical protein